MVLSKAMISEACRWHRWLRPVVCCIALAFSATSVDAQVTFNGLFPPVAKVGESATLTAEGKFPAWPPGIHCDRDDVKLTALKDSGKLQVSVDEDAAAGVAWIRLTDSQSASDWVPILVTAAKVVEETEPNDRVEDSKRLSLPAIVAGRLAKRGDSDSFQVHLEAGQTLVASLTANSMFGSPMDAVLQLTDIDGNVLLQSDDARGLDPQLVFTAGVDREAVIRVFAFPETPNSTIGFAGSADFVYAIEVTTGPFLDHVAVQRSKVAPYGYNLPPIGTEAEESESAATVQTSDPTGVSPAVASLSGALGWDWVRRPTDRSVTQSHRDEFDGSLPALISGHVQSSDDRHAYAFQASKGTRYRAEIRSRVYGFPLDSELVIVDKKSDQELARNDDVSRGGYDAGIEFVAKEDGPVEVRIGDLVGGYGKRHFYELMIAPVTPTFGATVSADRFLVSPEKSLEIVVSIDRRGGFDSDVRVGASGLPEGVTAEPVISKPKGDTSKSVKLKLTAAETPVVHDSFQIVAVPVNDAGEAIGEEVSASYTLRPSVLLTEFLLTVPKAAKK